MDYGKFKYDEKKRQAQARKKQVVVQIKEVKLRPRTDEHDYDFKVRNVKRFLEEGNKAKLTIMFRGREIVHKEIGQKILMRVVEDLKGTAVVEQTPRREGRQMVMIVAPDPKMKRPAPKPTVAKADTRPPNPAAAAAAVAPVATVAAAPKT
jgi:translation initiation factor IF-3